VIRINHLGLVAAILAVGFAAPSSAQGVTRDPCFYSREDCDARVRERTRQAEERAQRLADDRWTRDQEAKIRAEFQRDLQSRTRDQQQRTRELQERTRERQLDQARDLRERTIERAQQIRERELDRSREQMERAQEQRQREIERAQEQRQREIERAQELRERLVERAQTQRDAVVERAQTQRDAVSERRVYISPPPGIRFRNRWP
jgi:hypothetical protein